MSTRRNDPDGAEPRALSGRTGRIASRTAAGILAVLLALFRPSGGAESWTLGARTVPGPLPPSSTAPLPELDQFLDLTYGSAEGEALKLDLARPRVCRGQTLPLVIFVHGGGWHSGDKKGGLTRSDSRMFFQLGFAVASVNYRLSPQHHFPAHINDCKLAVRFLRTNAEEFGLDPARIGIWGSSAGGHLVSLMGMADDDDGLEGPGLTGVSSRPQAVVDHFGPEDLTRVWAGSEATIRDFLGAGASNFLALARWASPVTYVAAGDPPILIIHGDMDFVVPYGQAVALVEKLIPAGNSGALIQVRNAGHGFSPFPPGAAITPTRDRIDFLTVAHLARYLEPALLADLNMDGRVDRADYYELRRAMGMVGFGPGAAPAPADWNPLADLEPDGRIDLADWKVFWTRGGFF